jgi:hypothetical protein
MRSNFDSSLGASESIGDLCHRGHLLTDLGSW